MRRPRVQQAQEGRNKTCMYSPPLPPSLPLSLPPSLTKAVASNGLIAPPSRPPRAGDKNVQSEITGEAGEEEEEGA